MVGKDTAKGHSPYALRCPRTSDVFRLDERPIIRISSFLHSFVKKRLDARKIEKRMTVAARCGTISAHAVLELSADR